MCLIKGKEEESCVHHWCNMAAKKPKYYALFKRDYLMHHEGLKSFILERPTNKEEVMHEKYGSAASSWLVPHNHYSEDAHERHSFELFRQAMTSCAMAIGYWPEDRKIFDKFEVEYLFIEEKSEYRDYIIEGNSYREHWVTKVDVREVAIFIGEGGYHGL